MLALSEAVLEVSECILGSLDIEVFGIDFSISGLLGPLFGDIFGWFTVGIDFINCDFYYFLSKKVKWTYLTVTWN